jgi:integrase
MPSLIKKRGKNRYRASVMVKGIKKEKLFPDSTKQSFREAVIWENETKENLIKVQSQTNLNSLTAIEWANEYLEEAQNRFVDKTFRGKKSAFKRLIQFAQIEPECPVEMLSLDVCRKFLNYQFKTRSGYAANKDRKNLGTAWKWGLDHLADFPTGKNPFLKVQKFPEERSQRYVPPEDDFWKVYDIAESQDKVMLFSFLHLAARRNEIFGLKWDDVDFENTQIRLWTRKRKGGDKECDWLPMTTELRKALLYWWKERLSHNTVDKEYVFICLDKTPFCEGYYGNPFTVRQHYMKRICERAGVKPFGFHGIRHLTASVLYHKGYKLNTIQAILRHKSPRTTERYLKSLGLEHVREALEEGLKESGKVIPFNKEKTFRRASSEG